MGTKKKKKKSRMRELVVRVMDREVKGMVGYICYD
jgi:hypothetical protein